MFQLLDHYLCSTWLHWKWKYLRTLLKYYAPVWSAHSSITVQFTPYSQDWIWWNDKPTHKSADTLCERTLAANSLYWCLHPTLFSHFYIVCRNASQTFEAADVIYSIWAIKPLLSQLQTSLTHIVNIGTTREFSCENLVMFTERTTWLTQPNFFVTKLRVMILNLTKIHLCARPSFSHSHSFEQSTLLKI